MSPELLASFVSSDQGLNQQEKASLLDAIKRPEIAKLLSGAAGAALGVVLAKYARLGRTAQILLGIAGYGAGRILYNYLINNPHRQVAPYNAKLKTYELDRSRY